MPNETADGQKEGERRTKRRLTWSPAHHSFFSALLGAQGTGKRQSQTLGRTGGADPPPLPPQPSGLVPGGAGAWGSATSCQVRP